MTVAKIVAGQEYIFSIEGNQKALDRVSLSNSYENLLKYHGARVVVSEVSGSEIHQHVHIKSCRERFGNGYYYPPECFQPVKYKFVIGSEYICDHIPDDAERSPKPGWDGEMDDWCGKVLTCKFIYSDGAEACLELPGADETFVYAKHWVRPAEWAKPIRIVSRNVLNFWPGTK